MYTVWYGKKRDLEARESVLDIHSVLLSSPAQRPDGCLRWPRLMAMVSLLSIRTVITHGTACSNPAVMLVLPSW